MTVGWPLNSSQIFLKNILKKILLNETVTHNNNKLKRNGSKSSSVFSTLLLSQSFPKKNGVTFANGHWKPKNRTHKWFKEFKWLLKVHWRRNISERKSDSLTTTTNQNRMAVSLVAFYPSDRLCRMDPKPEL